VLSAVITKLAERRHASLRVGRWARLVKSAQKCERVRKWRDAFRKIAVAQFTPYPSVPFSSLTARSDYVANRKYVPQPKKPLTSQQQAQIDQLLAGMSKSRARVVDAHRRGRQSALTGGMA
jgi:hypothetical protein